MTAANEIGTVRPGSCKSAPGSSVPPESPTPSEMSSNAGGLPVWPAKLVILIGLVLLFLQMISEVIKRSAVLAGVIHDPVPESVHGHSPSDTSPAGGHNE